MVQAFVYSSMTLPPSSTKTFNSETIQNHLLIKSAMIFGNMFKVLKMLLSYLEVQIKKRERIQPLSDLLKPITFFTLIGTEKN